MNLIISSSSSLSLFISLSHTQHTLVFFYKIYIYSFFIIIFFQLDLFNSLLKQTVLDKKKSISLYFSQWEMSLNSTPNFSESFSNIIAKILNKYCKHFLKILQKILRKFCSIISAYVTQLVGSSTYMNMKSGLFALHCII